MTNANRNRIIRGDVVMGSQNVFEPGVVVYGPAIIGSNNYFGANAVVGAPPRQRSKTVVTTAELIIGDGNYFGESSRIHGPVRGRTELGSHLSIGAGTHVGHDCQLGSNITISVNCSIGGYSTLLNYCNLGMSVSVHPRTVVGPWAHAGMGSVVTTNVGVGSVVVGTPARHLRWNYEAFRRSELSWDECKELQMFLEHDLEPASSRLIELIERYRTALDTTVRNPVIRTWDGLFATYTV